MLNWRELALENLRNHRPHVLKAMSPADLETHLRDLEEQAEEMFASLHDAIRLQQGIPKEADFLKRVELEEGARAAAAEIVLKELILLPDPETEKAEREGGYA